VLSDSTSTPASAHPTIDASAGIDKRETGSAEVRTIMTSHSRSAVVESVTTRLLPSRPIQPGDPIFTDAKSKVLEPGLCDFRVHDMSVTVRLAVLGWQLATFKVDLDMGKFGDDTPTRSALDGACKRLSRRWVTAMTS
jgi:hypothetical protein